MKKGFLAVVTLGLGAAAGAAISKFVFGKKITVKAEKVDKFKGYYNLLNQWLINKNEGRSVSEYFTANGYQSIAIYGMGELGNRLLEELKGSSIEVKYAIDKNASGAYSEIDVVEPDGEMEKVDAVIVTAIFAFDEIEKELSGIIDCPIISLEDVIYNI